MRSRYHLLLLLAIMFVTSAATASERRDFEFTVLLGDREIGTHRFSLRDQDGTREVVSEADFRVRVLFLDAYRYSHRAVERWQDGCLTSIQSHTDDNGERLRVNGRVRDDGFTLQTPAGSATLPECVRSFAYWNNELLQANRLLNSQTGELEPVKVRNAGLDQVEVRGRSVTATRYEISGADYSIELWYSPDNEWLALESTTRDGHRLRYRIR